MLQVHGAADDVVPMQFGQATHQILQMLATSNNSSSQSSSSVLYPSPAIPKFVVIQVRLSSILLSYHHHHLHHHSLMYIPYAYCSDQY